MQKIKQLKQRNVKYDGVKIRLDITFLFHFITVYKIVQQNASLKTTQYSILTKTSKSYLRFVVTHFHVLKVLTEHSNVETNSKKHRKRREAGLSAELNLYEAAQGSVNWRSVLNKDCKIYS